jgi:hypothetical protein
MFLKLTIKLAQGLPKTRPLLFIDLLGTGIFLYIIIINKFVSKAAILFP